MNTINNPYLQAIFQEYGQQWDPSYLVDQVGEDSAAAFAIDVAKYANGILRSSILNGRCQNLKTKFIFVESFDINGFAGKISDTHEHYVVGITSGTVTELFNTFSSPRYLSILRKGLKILSSRTDSELHRYSLYFSTLFLVFHEFGHVFRGHINYAAKNKLANGPWMESHGQPVTDCGYTERRHLSECDADAAAGMLLAGEIQIHSTNIAKEFQMVISDIRSDLIVLAGTAIHFLFCLFDDQTKKVHPYYPPPHVRSAIVHGHLATQLVLEGLDPAFALSQLQQGLELAELLKNEMGLKHGSYDLASFYSKWQADYHDRLSKLGRTLAPFTPCNR